MCTNLFAIGHSMIPVFFHHAMASFIYVSVSQNAATCNSQCTSNNNRYWINYGTHIKILFTVSCLLLYWSFRRQ
jgi:hypothetical protein